MFHPIVRTLASGLTALAAAGAAPVFAQTTSFIDFETHPVIAQGPSIFIAVPGPQTIVTPTATFSGGVVLGLATFFPAISFASSPNVYGTADFGNGLSRTLTIDLNPANQVNQVSFALFNGETFNQSYQVDAFNGSSLVATQTLASVAPNFNSGYGIIDLQSTTNITQVTINAVGNPAAWDFLIDDVAINQSLTSVITTPLPPVYQPPVTPPVVLNDIENYDVVDEHGHKQKRNRKGSQSVRVDFGEDVNDIRGSVLLVQAVPAVPEPSSWALMLAGVGLIGGFMQRRCKQAPQA